MCIRKEGAMMLDVKELTEKGLQEVSGGSSEQEPVIISGNIFSYCGNLVFRVQLVNGRIVACEMDRKIKLKAIKLTVGDPVKVKLEQDNSCVGIIVEV